MFFSPDFKSEPQIINAARFGSRQEVISSLILPLSKFKGSHYTTGVGRWRGAPASPPDTLGGSTRGVHVFKIWTFYSFMSLLCTSGYPWVTDAF